MKVLFVDHTGQFGGGERSLFDLVTHLPIPADIAVFSPGPFVDALLKSGIPVKLLDPDMAGTVRRNAGALSIFPALPSVYKLQRRIATLAQNHNLIYANSQKAFIVSSLAARSSRKPLVWHLRDILTADHFSPVLRRVAVFLANRYASIVITNSHATRDSFVGAGGKSSLVRVVHNGISPAPFDLIDAHQASAARQELAPDASFLVGHFGRLSPWKGQHILLEAIATLPNIHAVIVGDALFGEDDYAEQLKARAFQPDLRGRVHFTGFRDDIPLLMRAVDAVAHTSVSPEPFGRVIVEGMLAGKPVIATRAGGALEIIRDGETGMFVTPGDPASLSAALDHLRTHNAFSELIAVQGQRAANADFSLEAMVTKIGGLLEELTLANGGQ